MVLYGVQINDNDFYDVVIADEGNNIFCYEKVVGENIIDIGDGFIQIYDTKYFIDDLLYVGIC